MNELSPKCEALIAALAQITKIAKSDLQNRDRMWQKASAALNAVHTPKQARSVKQAGALSAYLGRGFGLMYQSRTRLDIGVATLDPVEPEIRGQQWRLVMWYAGFEQVRRALVLGGPGSGGAQTEPESAAAARLRCDKAICALISGQFEAVQGGTAGNELGEVIDFLQLGKRHALAEWARGAQGPTSWLGLLELAADLRHATVHGALSARKIHQWQLKAGLEVLLSRLDQLTDAIDTELAEDQLKKVRLAKGVRPGA